MQKQFPPRESTHHGFNAAIVVLSARAIQKLASNCGGVMHTLANNTSAPALSENEYWAVTVLRKNSTAGMEEEARKITTQV